MTRPPNHSEDLWVFFYGLYMDPDLLADRGVVRGAGRPARVDGYELSIGDHADLVRRSGARAYGMAYVLSPGDLDLLYPKAGLTMYRLEPVRIEASGVTLSGVTAVLTDPAPHPAGNPAYADSLRRLMRRLPLPAEAVLSVRG